MTEAAEHACLHIKKMVWLFHIQMIVSVIFLISPLPVRIHRMHSSQDLMPAKSASQMSLLAQIEL